MEGIVLTNLLLVIVFSVCIQFFLPIIFFKRIAKMVSQEKVSVNYKIMSYIIFILIPLVVSCIVVFLVRK